MVATIKDVAKKAGVSTGTVSNYLSGKRRVSESVQERIQQAINELQYRTNVAGYSLVVKKSKTIGVIILAFEYGLAELLVSVDKTIREKGFSTLVCIIDNKYELHSKLLDFQSHNVDGIIVVFPGIHIREDLTTIINGIPIVFVLSDENQKFSSVTIDNEYGGYIATRHLIEHGCKKVGHITGDFRSKEVRERTEGCRKALNENGLSDEYFVEGDWTGETAFKKTYELIEMCPDIDGIFVDSDECAIAVLSGLNKIGKKVPDDIKVVGFDDAFFVRHLIPPLTSVYQNYNLIGQKAVDELFRRMEDAASQPMAIQVPVSLSERESSGCID